MCTAATRVTRALIFTDVFQGYPTATDSIKKNTVEATIAIEIIQNEMATGSLELRTPSKFLATQFLSSAMSLLAEIQMARQNAILLTTSARLFTHQIAADPELAHAK